MDMLLDYASDDDDDDVAVPAPAPAPAPAAAPAAASRSTSATPASFLSLQTLTLAHSRTHLSRSSPVAPPPPSPSLLPSAAELFDAPAGSSTKKRPQVNGSAHPAQHQPKVARSGSSSSAAVRTPPGATLVPPQLRGRSNVATEDLDKLFVQRQQRRAE